MRACGCTGAGTIVDQGRHDAFHELIAAQTGIAPPAELSASSLQRARGMRTGSAEDHKGRAKNLASGKSSPGWRREQSR